MIEPTDNQDITATAERAEPMASTDPEDHRDITECSIFCSLAAFVRLLLPTPQP